ncbi:hypothetical protein [Coleofasciculus sp. G2-EDA-02]|uniref:hypothetical protein n=1 Tax=Coleofasciculus sp. G2-EDA-02 TaxID=3069529 RepID=UPI0032FAE6BC
MSDPQTTNPISQAKEKVAEAIPTPASPQQMPESSAQALKSRLQWGEPALTILDVRYPPNTGQPLTTRSFQ